MPRAAQALAQLVGEQRRALDAERLGEQHAVAGGAPRLSRRSARASVPSIVRDTTGLATASVISVWPPTR